jgi:hypothetical protein
MNLSTATNGLNTCSLPPLISLPIRHVQQTRQTLAAASTIDQSLFRKEDEECKTNHWNEAFITKLVYGDIFKAIANEVGNQQTADQKAAEAKASQCAICLPCFQLFQQN